MATEKKKVTAQAKGRMKVAAKEQKEGSKRNVASTRATAAWKTGGEYTAGHPATERYRKALKHDMKKGAK